MGTSVLDTISPVDDWPYCWFPLRSFCTSSGPSERSSMSRAIGPVRTRGKRREIGLKGEEMCPRRDPTTMQVSAEGRSFASATALAGQAVPGVGPALRPSQLVTPIICPSDGTRSSVPTQPAQAQLPSSRREEAGRQQENWLPAR